VRGFPCEFDLRAEGEATVSQVHESLAGPRARALTTIATMLSKMEKKGVVRHRNEGRLFIYRPTVSEACRPSRPPSPRRRRPARRGWHQPDERGRDSLPHRARFPGPRHEGRRYMPSW